MNATHTGRLIAQARKEKQLTQKNLSQALHVSVQAVSKWERGLNFPDIALLEPLASLLDLTVSELLSGAPGGLPGEELVLDSLRVGQVQFGTRVRRWRGLFWSVLALLLVLLLGGGYLYARDHTELLPQKETTAAPRQSSQLDVLTAQARGETIAFFDLVLADDLDSFALRWELWTHDGMAECWSLGGLSGLSQSKPARRQTMAVRWSSDPHAPSPFLTYDAVFNGAAWRGILDSQDIPYLAGGYAAGLLEARTAVSPSGTVLLCLSLDAGRGGWRAPAYVGMVETLSPAVGEAFLLLRLTCA